MCARGWGRGLGRIHVFLDSSRRTDSRWSGLVSWRIRMWRSSIVSALLLEFELLLVVLPVLLVAGEVVEEDGGVFAGVPPRPPRPPT